MIEVAVADKVLSRFVRLSRSGRLAHAYLFTGPQEIGKSQAALEVAKLVNCEQGAQQTICGSCPSCIKIAAGNHPDVDLIDIEEGQSIRIEKVRELIRRIQLKPYEARRKVIIIRNIEHLTLEGSNALLKTLEEPAKDTLLLLTTSVPELSLGTIRSRCHEIRFFPLSKDRLQQLLTKDDQTGDVPAEVLSGYSEGCLGRARNMLAEDFFDKKNDIIDNVIFRQDNEQTLKALLSDREAVRVALEVLLAWFRDLLLVKAGQDQRRLVNTDRIKDLRPMSERYSFGQISGIIAAVVDATRQHQENLNIKIPFALIKELIWARSST